MRIDQSLSAVCGKCGIVCTFRHVQATNETLEEAVRDALQEEMAGVRIAIIEALQAELSGMVAPAPQVVQMMGSASPTDHVVPDAARFIPSATGQADLDGSLRVETVTKDAGVGAALEALKKVKERG